LQREAQPGLRQIPPPPVSRIRPWLLAARPPTLWAAVAPVLVGGGLAADDGAFRWDVFAVTLVAAVLINISVNFANDASDAHRGADSETRIGPTRAVASGLIPARSMWAGVAVCFALAAAAGIYLTSVAGWPILAIGVASLVAALGYTGGPLPYGYLGLGEVSVFLFFGLAATVGSRFAHDSAAPLDSWLLAIPIGMLVTAILVANNVRDIDTDRTAGKRTLAVMLGRPATRHLFAVLVLGAFPLIAAFAALGWTPAATAIAVAALPLAVPPVRTVYRETAGPALIAGLQGTARLHVVVGALIGLGAAL
ncbi:MAG: 1,4-dihydroxy-2-naphthoate polyprenyltransferase, partial [Acidimicrobiia bacterium]|nr:1,4-dihydroxy-2-naphthoate polyprenyltransferase [Acidimicrobiia bacterium]